MLSDTDSDSGMEPSTCICRAIGVESSRYQGHYTEYLIMAQIEGAEGMKLLPPLDREDVELEVFVGYDIPEVARDAFREGELIYRITSFLHNRLRRTMNSMGPRRADLERFKMAMMTWISQVYIDSGDDKNTCSFLEGAVEAMEQVYRERSDPFYDAGESRDASWSRIESFVEKNIDSLKHPPIELREEPTLRATQIEVPKALRRIASVLFVATVPQVPRVTEQEVFSRPNVHWPAQAGPAPFVRFHIPVMESGIDLATAASMAAQLAKENEETQAADIFQASIAADDGTMLMELAAMATLKGHEVKMSDFGRMSRYLLGFHHEVQYYVVAETFPVLEEAAGRAMADETTPVDDAGVFRTDTLSRVLANIEAPRQPLPHKDAMDALWEEFQHLDPDQKAVFSSLMWLPYATLNVVGAARTGKTHVCLLTVLMACEEMLVAVEDDDRGTTKAQALACCATDARADELCAKFDEVITRRRLSLKVVRLDTIDRELANATGKGFVEEETVFDPLPTEGPSSTFDQEVYLIMDSYREMKLAKNKINGGIYSVSEIAHAKLEAYQNGVEEDDEYSDIVSELSDHYQLRKTDRRMFDDDLAERYRQLWKELIMMIIEDAQICVTTPVVAKQLAGLDEVKQHFEPQIIWSDDVGHTTEASALAPLAFFPEARLRILSGDPESEVMMSSVLAAGKHGSTSILKRMERDGAPVCRLRVVHDGAFDTA
ncbi:hypothetical protein PG985_001661 [Apiospora marii]|uniref:uncharacterized protein n=1 Tax=Apiospora marii TaxID=335849 RepID=UPI003131C9E8